MKATITYELPEELPELLVHLKGQSYLTALWEVDQRLRTTSKHGEDEAEGDFADNVRTMIREELEYRGCSLEDGE